ncbi:MAG: hypothetical protein WDN29_10765 [Methylovirgula sp.]
MVDRLDVPTQDAGIGIAPWRPVKKIVEYRVCTKSEGNPHGWRVGQFCSGWWREVAEQANLRAEATDLPIYEIAPTVENVERVIANAPPGIFIIHRLREENGPDIYDWPGSYDDARIARVESHAPPLPDDD